MGMSLSFRDSVREAMDAAHKARGKCGNPSCETKLSKAYRDLNSARQEIGVLQNQLS